MSVSRLELLEREGLLTDLAAHLGAAIRGDGAVVLIGGEAGAGKSSLVREFVARAEARVLLGACDGAATAAPLGPLVDVAGVLGLPADPAQWPERGQLFTAVRAGLATTPTIFVVEDIHWADEATLDLLRYLTRRLTGLATLLLATYRDDEAGPSHPLTLVMGDLAASGAAYRMQVPLLSEAAVAELAASAGAPVAGLFVRTGGNPFFVSEVLAAGHLPPSVRDAVLARVARLSPNARDALAAASVLGAHGDVGTIPAVSRAPAEAVDECVACGMLVPSASGLRFRHELAREAIYSSLPVTQRVQLHASAYAHLVTTGRAAERDLAHHAQQAGDAAGVRAHAVRAAALAAALGAHREAAEHYRARFATRLNRSGVPTCSTACPTSAT